MSNGLLIYTLFHVALSVVMLVAGAVVVTGLLRGRDAGPSVTVFLVFSIATNASTRRVSMTATVAFNVISRMILVPTVIWIVLPMSGLPSQVLRDVVLMMALPAAALSVILAVRFRTVEQEMSSTLFFANIIAPITLGTLIWLTA